MTDYNDGKWHGWNGGECPVHPQTIVDVATSATGICCNEMAEQWFWDGDRCRIVAFRVVKPYREPREWWLRINTNGEVRESDPVNGPPPRNWGPSQIIRVREVLE